MSRVGFVRQKRDTSSCRGIPEQLCVLISRDHQLHTTDYTRDLVLYNVLASAGTYAHVYAAFATSNVGMISVPSIVQCERSGNVRPYPAVEDG